MTVGQGSPIRRERWRSIAVAVFVGLVLLSVLAISAVLAARGSR